MAKSKAKSAPKAPKITGSAKRRSKGEIFSTIAEHVGVTRKQVSQVFDVMGTMIGADLTRCGEFAVPGMMRIKTIKKPATKAATKPNPFKPGEMMTVKAKPARTLIKIRPLKGLKEMV
ncbi:MAG: HU family DNA-binding protein [Phycisphaeraceae bacterium]|nr:HU family DNA-binding protein [Phycisphaerae bacterium]MBX3393111.1 HU family DNA-binding protein [Phycisphaeraceae bacterium]HRJ49616.1 HU family DNA-binding protein [Phycisphaerales bacterium]